jgi:ABC-type histidine transport system ATPase subunit
MNDLTGERNVVLGCLAGGMTRAEVAERYDDIVEFSGVNDNGDFISLPMRTYSSGMSARLRFSIAAAKSHDVLLVDEALSTGDAEFRRRSEARIRELRQEAGAVFLVGHSRRRPGILRAHDLARPWTHRRRRRDQGRHRRLQRPPRSAGARATAGGRAGPLTAFVGCRGHDTRSRTGSCGRTQTPLVCSLS